MDEQNLLSRIALALKSEIMLFAKKMTTFTELQNFVNEVETIVDHRNNLYVFTIWQRWQCSFYLSICNQNLFSDQTSLQSTDFACNKWLQSA